MNIRKENQLKVIVVDDHIEQQLGNKETLLPETGFAMLKSERSSVPANFDVAGLLETS